MPLATEITRTLDTILARAVGANEPGVAVGIAQRGRIVWSGARGLANLKTRSAFSAQTPFRICSISKQFACALVMREVAAGRVALDAHPSRYLPWTKAMDSALTIAHLMQNKSGIRDQWVLAMMMGATATQRFTLRDGIEVNRRAPESMFAPGSQNSYCNANFEIVGQILEVVTGETYAQLLATNIFAPLGMRDSFLGVDSAQSLPTDSRGYRFHDGVWVEEENGLHWAASAGIVSTVEDLLKWAACLRDPRAVGLAWVEAITRAAPFNDGNVATYASGINHAINLTTQREMIGHAGALRGWRSILMHFVNEDTSIAVFMNRTNGPQKKYPRAIANDVVKALGIAPVWRMPGEKLRRASLPEAALGTYVSREQGLLIQLRNHKGQAQIFSHLDWSPLFRTDIPGAFATDDRHLVVRFDKRNHASLLLTMKDENVHTPMQRVVPPRASNIRFAARGRYHCAPLASTLEIVAHDGGTEIVFTGIFGTGTAYPLTRVNARTACFDISRGVDESPPGRVLVIFEPKQNLLELSCMLARRVVFRAAKD